MNNPQERIIKKMIDNIVENNKPYIDKPAGMPAPSTDAAASVSTPASSTSTPAMAPEDFNLISRKLEYGFNSLRQESAEIRKQIDDLLGAIKMLRNDMDQVRMSVQQRGRDAPMGHASPAPHQDSQEAPRGMGGGTQVGAPQYRKSEADEAYERETGQPAHHDEEAPQARGIQKKSTNADIDIAKVFYYGKK